VSAGAASALCRPAGVGLSCRAAKTAWRSVDTRAGRFTYRPYRGAPRGWPKCAPPAPARRSIRPARCAAQPRSTLTGAHLRPGPRGSLPRAWPTPAHQCAHQPPDLLAGRNGGRAGPPRWSPVLVAHLCCQQCAPLSLTLLAVLPAQAIGERGDESGEMHQLLQPSWLQLVCSSQRDSVHASCSSSSSKMRIEMPTLVVSAAFALMCR